MMRAGALRGSCALLCYVDHSERFERSQPRRPVAAFSGQPFPDHVTRALEGHARRVGFTSPYWLSKAAIRSHRVMLRPNVDGVPVCMDEAASRPTEMFHAETIDAGDMNAFLAEYPIPEPAADSNGGGIALGVPPPERDANGAPSQPWLYRSGKWRRLGHAGAALALKQFRNTHGLRSDIWLSEETVRTAGLRPIPGAHAIPVHEQAPTLFYNAEQTTMAPERFAPPYNAESGTRAVVAASASAVADDEAAVTIADASRIAHRLQRRAHLQRMK